ncbi:MAG TPA: 4Fe-4S dicluster domain-containing protein, partial [bacterium]|nr:4Fe-4S dicluster domain-containing protein [bacterium]
VDDFIHGLATGSPSRHAARAPNVGDALMGILFGTVGRRFLGKLYFADQDCDACGLCVRRCPAGAVVLGRRKGARPFWKLSCEDCNACMNLCPRKAVNTSWARMVLFLALIVAAIWVGTGVYYRFVRPAIAPALTPALATVVDIVMVTLIVLASHLLPLWLVDTFLLRFLQRLPGVRRIFAWTFTKSFRRYSAAQP